MVTQVEEQVVESVTARLRKLVGRRSLKTAISTVKLKLSSRDRAGLIDYALQSIAQAVLRERVHQTERAAFTPLPPSEPEPPGPIPITPAEPVPIRCLLEGPIASIPASEPHVHGGRDCPRNCKCFDEVFADPGLLYGPARCGEGLVYWNYDGRQGFKAWVKWKEGGLGAWVDRAVELFPDREEHIHNEWFGYSTSPELLQKLAAETMKLAQQFELQITTKLLTSTFALGDGRLVTWGAATIPEHRQRMVLLQKNAAGNIETAARHAKAIELLEGAGVPCLNEYQPPV
jgi:hypothetical protein